MTAKQQLFILEYSKCLNATEAAKRAGYSAKTAYSIGQELLKKPEIQEALQTALNERKNSLIADRDARKEFWTSVMNDADQAMKERLRASELLGKSEGDFTDRREVQADISVQSEYDLSKLNEDELLTLKELLTKAK